MVRLTGLRTLLLFDFKAVTQLAPLAALRELRALSVAGFDGLNHPGGMQLSICTACRRLQARHLHAPATPCCCRASGIFVPGVVAGADA